MFYCNILDFDNATDNFVNLCALNFLSISANLVSKCLFRPYANMHYSEPVCIFFFQDAYVSQGITCTVQ